GHLPLLLGQAQQTGMKPASDRCGNLALPKARSRSLVDPSIQIEAGDRPARNRKNVRNERVQCSFNRHVAQRTVAQKAKRIPPQIPEFGECKDLSHSSQHPLLFFTVPDTKLLLASLKKEF